MKRFSLLVVMLISGLLLAACGGSQPESGAGPSSLEFDGNDSFQFIPDSAAADAGTRAKVTLNNMGSLEHSWVLVPEGTDVNTVSEDDAIDGGFTGVVPPGEFKFVEFNVPDAGTYQFMCTIPGHAAAGMVGTFTAN